MIPTSKWFKYFCSLPNILEELNTALEQYNDYGDDINTHKTAEELWLMTNTKQKQSILNIMFENMMDESDCIGEMQNDEQFGLGNKRLIKIIKQIIKS